MELFQMMILYLLWHLVCSTIYKTHYVNSGIMITFGTIGYTKAKQRKVNEEKKHKGIIVLK